MKHLPKLVVLLGLMLASWILVIGGTAVAAKVAVKLGRHAHAMHLTTHLSTLTGINYPTRE